MAQRLPHWIQRHASVPLGDLGQPDQASGPLQRWASRLPASMALAFIGSLSPLLLQTQPLQAQVDSACMGRDAEGRTLDLSRLCGSSRGAARPTIFAPTLFTVQPETLPANGQRLGVLRPSLEPLVNTFNHGVIFLKPLSPTPKLLNQAIVEFNASVGNASPFPVSRVTVFYDVSVPQSGGGFVKVGQGMKEVAVPNLFPGQQSFFKIHRNDLRQAASSPYRSSPELAVQVTALGWRTPDGQIQSFGPDSVNLAAGVGRCDYPWERDRQGKTCGSTALSLRSATNAGSR